jgi:hypothetical protein
MFLSRCRFLLVPKPVIDVFALDVELDIPHWLSDQDVGLWGPHIEATVEREQ